MSGGGKWPEETRQPTDESQEGANSSRVECSER